MASKIDPSTPMVVQLRDARGVERGELDFRSLRLNQALAEALKDAFEALTGLNSLESRRHAWRHIKLFSEFLKEVGRNNKMPLPVDILLTFRCWLDVRPVSEPYKAAIYNQLAAILLWCSRNSYCAISQQLRTDVPRFHTIKNVNPKVSLDAASIKRILRAAYHEIDDVMERLGSAWNEAQFRRESAGQKGNLQHLQLAQQLVRVAPANSLFPSKPLLLAKHPKLARAAVEAGGLVYLSTLLYPCAADVFPFYLAILAQCSANPMSLRGLRRDSVRPHPLRDDRLRVVWTKDRSGYEQKADFAIYRHRAAPKLIEALNGLTSRIRPFAESHDRNMAFLAYWSGRVTVPSWQALHNLLGKFIERHGLSNFDFKDLRKAGAELHRATTGSMVTAAQRLNHRSTRTTELYVSVDKRREEHDAIVHLSQIELQKNALVEMPLRRRDSNSEILASGPAETVFGFVCRDPYMGMAEGEKSGTLCASFTSCATCPGAIIPLDDPNIVAKLIRALAQLCDAEKRATEQGWVERYIALYKKTKEVIEHDLLTRVSPAVLHRAKEIAGQQPMLFLE